MIEAGIAYQVHGEGLPVVLLHGAAGTQLSWPAQVRRLSGRRVYALDLPGHGKSAAQPCHSIEEIAQQALEWHQALDLPPAVWVGHSMGSAVALQAALLRPGSVAALILSGSGATLRVNPKLLEMASSPQTYHQAMERIVAWSFSRGAPPRLVELALKRMSTTPQAVLHADLLACDTFNLAGRLGEIRSRALVVCGAEDRMTPLVGAQALVAGLPQARLEVLASAGHMPMLEEPLAFVALLEVFIKGITKF